MHPRPLAKINPRSLFLPYLILVPVIILLIGDRLFGLGIGKHMPTSPNQVLLLGVFFENPHIIASSLMWLDTDYLSKYRTRLIQGVVLTLTICAFVWKVTGLEGLLVFFYMWTVWHVIRQQIGIGRMLNRQKDQLYEVWSWLFLVGSFLVAAKIGFPAVDLTSSVRTGIDIALLFIVICAASLSMSIFYRLKSPAGRTYIMLNTLLLVTSAACVSAGLPFFAILLPRVVHDITAYMFYVNHDRNRNASESRNLVYRYTVPYFSVAVVCIVFSMSLAAWVTFTPTYYAFYTGVALAFLHYTTEAFVWKRGSHHRQHLFFAE